MTSRERLVHTIFVCSGNLNLNIWHSVCFAPLAGVSRSGTSFPERFGITNCFSHRIASSMATGLEHIVSSSFHKTRCPPTTCPHGSRTSTHRAVCGCGMSCRNARFCLVHTLISLLCRVLPILCSRVLAGIFECPFFPNTDANARGFENWPSKLVIVHVVANLGCAKSLGVSLQTGGIPLHPFHRRIKIKPTKHRKSSW